ncbi:hypothetical protein CRUP_038418 [Coryphaenoides rupestris]|nr:hypothetical protein CRUP_038418 [Coryphaenoides rupestris]
MASPAPRKQSKGAKLKSSHLVPSTAELFPALPRTTVRYSQVAAAGSRQQAAGSKQQAGSRAGWLPTPAQCFTANGEDYRGFQNQTGLQAGKPCLYWNETFQHPYNTLKYPNGEGGLGPHNFCRNPDRDVQPWCYIADNEDGIYWRLCDIPTCQKWPVIRDEGGGGTPQRDARKVQNKCLCQNNIPNSGELVVATAVEEEEEMVEEVVEEKVVVVEEVVEVVEEEKVVVEEVVVEKEVVEEEVVEEKVVVGGGGGGEGGGGGGGGVVGLAPRPPPKPPGTYPPSVPGNLGCFKDSGDPPTLSGTSETSNKLTMQNCISFCRKQRYKLAGMESGYACFCGNELDLRDHVEAPSMECNHVCFGDHTQPCGGDGWVIIFDTRVGSCGGNYTAPTDVIYSPDFPDKYASGRVCYWTVQVPGAAALLFNFTFFDISDQTDMVELLDGHSSQVLARFDGRHPPRELINVTGDHVILYFYSDRTNRAQGFALLYQALMGQDSNSLLEEEDERRREEEGGDLTSQATPPLDATEKSNGSSGGRSSQIMYVITTSPDQPEHNMPVWTIYALAALLTLTVIAMLAKLLLHITVKRPPPPPSSPPAESENQSVASTTYTPLESPGLQAVSSRLGGHCNIPL